MTPDISLEDHIHSVLEIEPYCEYFNDGTYGDCGNSNPAVYLVVYRNPMTCGCVPVPQDKYFCEECWATRTAGTVRHPECGATNVPPMENVARITRIKP